MTFKTPIPSELSTTELAELFGRQRAAFFREGPPSAAVRRNRLDRLSAALLGSAGALVEALTEDFGGRPEQFSLSVDILGVHTAIEHLRANLEDWMKPVEVVHPAAAYAPTTVDINPLGVVGVVGPWNFPVQLVLHPAAEAIAAGNRVMIKFSDVHPRTGQVLARAVSQHFDPEELVIVNGDLGISTAFSSLPFDHLFFTGSPAVGKLVQKAAAENLTPVTLELGGKNPVVVGHDAEIATAAERIVGSRLINGGQVCLCPDYVFVPAPKLDHFIGSASESVERNFPNITSNPGVTPIVNERNFDRINDLILDAIAKGATAIECGGKGEGLKANRENRRIPLTLLLGVTEEMRIATEEVFGPVLSIFAYDDVREPINYVNSHASPLVAYWYGEDSADFSEFRLRTTSGGIARNDFAAHALMPDVPFGGVGRSGMGSYHGKTGFETFSHKKAVGSSLLPDPLAFMGLPAKFTPEALEELQGSVQTGLAAALSRIAEGA